jgi:hypothetical protein
MYAAKAGDKDYARICVDSRCRVEHRASFVTSVPDNGIRVAVERNRSPKMTSLAIHRILKRGRR